MIQRLPGALVLLVLASQISIERLYIDVFEPDDAIGLGPHANFSGTREGSFGHAKQLPTVEDDDEVVASRRNSQCMPCPGLETGASTPATISRLPSITR